MWKEYTLMANMKTLKEIEEAFEYYNADKGGQQIWTSLHLTSQWSDLPKRWKKSERL